MKIREIMSKAVDPIDPATTIATAAGRMRELDVGCLLVGCDEHPCGIVTDRDIVVRALALGRKASHDPVSRIMSRMLVWCFEDQPIEEAARLMAEHGVRRLPVLDREGALCGILSLSDIRGEGSRKKPWQVTFYREVSDSRGAVHKTPLTTLYIAKSDSKAKAAAAAREIFEGDGYAPQISDASHGYRISRELAACAAAAQRGDREERSGSERGLTTARDRARLEPASECLR